MLLLVGVLVALRPPGVVRPDVAPEPGSSARVTAHSAMTADFRSPNEPKPSRIRDDPGSLRHYLVGAARPASSRATGTRNGEQET